MVVQCPFDAGIRTPLRERAATMLVTRGSAASTRKGLRQPVGASLGSVVIVDDGLAARPVIIFLLDYSRPIAWLAFFNDCRAIPIAITVRHAAYGDTNTNRADVNADILRHRRRRDRADGGRNQQILFHSPSPALSTTEKSPGREFVPKTNFASCEDKSPARAGLLPFCRERLF